MDRDLGANGRGAGLRLVTVATLVLALLGANSGAVRAQNVSFPEPSESQNAESVKSIKQGLVSLPAAGSTRVPSLSMNVEATSTDKTGAVSVVVGSKSDAFTAGATVSGPLDATKTAEPLSRAGLANGARVEVGLHWFIWQNENNEAEARTICRRNVHVDRCDDNEIANADERLLFLRALGALADPVVIDVTAFSGRNTFRYLDPTNLAAGKQEHGDHGLGVSVGRYAPTTGLVSVGYGYAREWRVAAAPRNICTPIPGTSGTECRNVTVGAPSQETTHELTLEERIFFLRGRAAAAPRVGYNLAGKETTISVPVYFIAAKDSHLAGGVRTSWSSRDRGATVALFVGPAFTLFK